MVAVQWGGKNPVIWGASAEMGDENQCLDIHLYLHYQWDGGVQIWLGEWYVHLISDRTTRHNSLVWQVWDDIFNHLCTWLTCHTKLCGEVFDLNRKAFTPSNLHYETSSTPVFPHRLLSPRWQVRLEVVQSNPTTYWSTQWIWKRMETFSSRRSCRQVPTVYMIH